MLCTDCDVIIDSIPIREPNPLDERDYVLEFCLCHN